jgi:Tfp pilus assembly protein PilV
MKGMTLIEVLIYIFLLSFLLAGFIQYVYAVQAQDMSLMQNIQDAYANQ